MQLAKKLGANWVIAILLFLYACIQVYCIHQLTINYDEGLFANYGVTILKLQGNKDIVKFDSKLPVTALNMLPRAIEQVLQPNLRRPGSYTDIINGRYVSLLAAMVLAIVVYCWSFALYGRRAGLCSFLFFLICPNFLAHAVFVSSDIFASLFMTTGFYFLWKYCNSGETKQFFFASLAVAMAEISKFSMVHLLLLFPFLLLTVFFFRQRYFPKLQLDARKMAALLILFAVVNWFVISAGHLFYGMFIPLNHYQFQSGIFLHLQAGFGSVANWLPVPLPSSYLKSLDLVIHLDSLGGGVAGNTINPPYILGKQSVYGFWYYYFVAMFFKMPLPVLLLIVLTAGLYLRKMPAGSFFKNDFFFLLPVIYFLVYLNFFYSTQIGIRHIIIIFPMLYIFLGFFFQQMAGIKGRWFCYALLAYQCISVGRYFPHFLPYTNELIADKKMAYKKIADTNLCYGEGIGFLKTYLQQHPEAQYLPPGIRSGTIIMEVNEILDLKMATMGKYDWVKGLQPTGHIHSQFLIFEVSPAMADSLRKVNN